VKEALMKEHKRVAYLIEDATQVFRLTKEEWLER